MYENHFSIQMKSQTQHFDRNPHIFIVFLCLIGFTLE